MPNEFLNFEYDYNKSMFDYDYSGSYYQGDNNSTDSLTTFVATISDQLKTIGNIKYNFYNNLGIKYEKKDINYVINDLSFSTFGITTYHGYKDKSYKNKAIETVSLFSKNILLEYNLTNNENYVKDSFNLVINQNFLNFDLDDYNIKCNYNLTINSVEGGAIGFNLDCNKILNDWSIYGFDVDYKLYLCSHDKFNTENILSDTVSQIYYQNNKDSDFNGKIYFEYYCKNYKLSKILPQTNINIGTKIFRG